jgi:hypothetical protein
MSTKTVSLRLCLKAASAAEKSLVTKIPGDVRGAKSVNNSMTVKS